MHQQCQYTSNPPSATGTPICYSVPTVQVVRAGPRTYDTYSETQSRGLGATQMIIGFLCIAFNIVAIRLRYDEVAVVGHGIWSGILFVITGCFGVAAAKQKTSCPIVTFMVLSIISSVNCISLLTIGLVGACLVAEEYNCNEYGFNGFIYKSAYYCMNTQNAVIAMESMLAILALIEAVLAIWSSAICCKAVCCCSARNTVGGLGIVYSSHPVNGHQFVTPHVVFTNQQQYQPMAGQQTYLPTPQGVPVYSGYPYNVDQTHQFAPLPPPYVPYTNISAPQYTAHYDPAQTQCGQVPVEETPK